MGRSDRRTDPYFHLGAGAERLITISSKDRYLACGLSEGSVKIWEVASRMEDRSFGSGPPTLTHRWLMLEEQLIVANEASAHIRDISSDEGRILTIVSTSRDRVILLESTTYRSSPRFLLCGVAQFVSIAPSSFGYHLGTGGQFIVSKRGESEPADVGALLRISTADCGSRRTTINREDFTGWCPPCDLLYCS